MLSSALQKANTAVLLDNANNFEGAMEAYSDACVLLGHVMVRAGLEDDKRKLMNIRDTYWRRIEELKALAPIYRANEKELPATPRVEQFADADATSPEHDGRPRTNETISARPPRRDSLMPGSTTTVTTNQRETLQPRRIVMNIVEEPAENLGTQRSTEHIRENMKSYREETDRTRSDGQTGLQQVAAPPKSPRADEFTPAHTRSESEVSTSWLNTFDESEGSSSGSSTGVKRRKRKSRLASHNNGAKEISSPKRFVERITSSRTNEEMIASGLDVHSDIIQPNLPHVKSKDAGKPSTNLGTTKENEGIISHSRNGSRVTQDHRYSSSTMAETELKASGYDFFSGQPNEEVSDPRGAIHKQDHMKDDDDDIYDEEEDATRVQTLDDFQFDLDDDMKPDIETRDTSGRRIRRRQENLMSSSRDIMQPPPLLPTDDTFGVSSNHELLTQKQGDSSPTASKQPYLGVRERRLSGRPASTVNNGPLTIETTTTLPGSAQPPEPDPQQYNDYLVSPVDSKSVADTTRRLLYAVEQDRVPQNTRQNSVAVGRDETSFMEAPLDTGRFLHSRSPLSPDPSPSPMHIKQMKSTQSLRTTSALQQEVMSPLSGPYSAQSPSAQLRNLRSTSHLMASKSTTSYASLPTGGLPTGGYHLFDSKLHSPSTPSMNTGHDRNVPIPLEEMPNEPFSKPFWLMRCLFQSINHPRGGYLTSKLFVPRDIWLMKGVKLRAIEEKITVCDSLTAALGKLANIDRAEADSLLKEMQDLEVVMGRAETILSKKLGSDVGASGLASMLKGEAGNTESSGQAGDSKSSGGTAGGKGYLSWKKLRSKNSSSVINSSYNSFSNRTSEGDSSSGYDASFFGSAGGSGATGGGGGNSTYPDNDMKGKGTLAGPHGAYTFALAKLFDAAQVLDRLSIHIEGNNNLHITTQVGLELVISRASEFFGLVVCRFVLADVALLLDKYIKRGTEWVIL